MAAVFVRVAQKRALQTQRRGQRAWQSIHLAMLPLRCGNSALMKTRWRPRRAATPWLAPRRTFYCELRVRREFAAAGRLKITGEEESTNAYRGVRAIVAECRVEVEASLDQVRVCDCLICRKQGALVHRASDEQDPVPNAAGGTGALHLGGHAPHSWVYGWTNPIQNGKLHHRTTPSRWSANFPRCRPT